MFIARYCTRCLRPSFTTGTYSWPNKVCTVITLMRIKIYHDGKNRAVLRSLWPYWHPDESGNPADVLRSTQHRLLMLTAGPLAFRPKSVTRRTFSKLNWDRLHREN